MRHVLALAALVLGLTVTAIAQPVAQFGIITDIHHTNKPDSSTRFYSAALQKTQYFVDQMNAADAAFVIELGDLVDTLVDDKDPLLNLSEVEDIFTSFEGPQYHVLGNHEFDNLTREQFLPNITNTGIPVGETYYSFDIDGVHCIVLDADYTVAPPHLPFDMETEGNDFWHWTDAWVPDFELEWLAEDLAQSDLPTFVFTHQLLNRDNSEDHTIKNADVVRAILEADGDVVACFAGHDHAGDYSLINDIHYVVLEGNVGMGTDPVAHNQYAWIEFNGVDPENGLYELIVAGHAEQDSYELVVELDSSVALENPGQATDELPTAAIDLGQNYPNPFNPKTTIGYALETASQVNLSVFDLQGRHVRTLVDGVRAAGPQQIDWDGTDASGQRVASGTYMYRLTTPGRVLTRTMILAK